jgi:hypothetical protein
MTDLLWVPCRLVQLTALCEEAWATAVIWISEEEVLTSSAPGCIVASHSELNLSSHM